MASLAMIRKPCRRQDGLAYTLRALGTASRGSIRATKPVRPAPRKLARR